VEFIDEIKEMEDSLLGLKFEDLDFNDEFIEDKN
jgi:hypothetical protein